jgi:hypothetical protein
MIVLGGNLLSYAPFSADDLLQIIICYGVIAGPRMLKAASPPSMAAGARQAARRPHH